MNRPLRPNINTDNFPTKLPVSVNASMLLKFIGQTSSKFSPSIQSHVVPVVSKVGDV